MATKAKKRKENPKSIDRYVKEYAEQKGYKDAESIPNSEKGKAYAIAWSRYCSKRPGSPRCKKDKGTYFPNRPNISKGIAKSMEEKRQKRMGKKASEAMAERITERYMSKVAYVPKDPTADKKNHPLIDYLYNNDILKFFKKGNLSGRAGVFFYPKSFMYEKKNPKYALYLSGRSLAIMSWENGKWVNINENPLKPYRENPKVLNRTLTLMKKGMGEA
jgi:hypothetical protein